MTKCMTVCSKEKEGDGKWGVDRGEGKGGGVVKGDEVMTKKTHEDWRLREVLPRD